MDETREIIENIRQALQDQGAEITIRSITRGEYDPSTGTALAATDDPEEDTMGVFLGYHTRDIDGTNILSTDMRCIVIGDLEFPPKRDDLIIRWRDDAAFTVVDVKTYELTDQPVTFICQVRNAGANLPG